MAFTTLEKQKFAIMFASTPTIVSAHITSLGATVTADLETDVRAQLLRWTNGTAKGRVWFEKTESNEGFNMSAVNTADNSDPIANIARLLEWPYSIKAATAGTMQIG